MLRTKTKAAAAAPTNAGEMPVMECEMRPGGMLVQKRTGSERNPVSAPMIRVRVKYGSVYHKICISSEASFGDLKKMLVGPTGVNQLDQKVVYREKERDSKTFLDVCGVKDGSKMVVLEDPISQEKRVVELRRKAKMEKASNFISQISLEVDRLAGQVSALESVIGKGGKVAEKTVLNLIESLMDQLIRLDGIMGDGDVKSQRKMQVRRVQKYVETLDILKIKNEKQTPIQVQPRNSDGPGQVKAQADDHRDQMPNVHQAQLSKGALSPLVPERKSASETMVTTRWEIFDAMPPLVPTPSPITIPATTNNNNHVQPKFNWEIFD